MSYRKLIDDAAAMLKTRDATTLSESIGLNDMSFEQLKEQLYNARLQQHNLKEGSAEQLANRKTIEQTLMQIEFRQLHEAKHDDTEEDKKLIKQMVKPEALKEGGQKPYVSSSERSYQVLGNKGQVKKEFAWADHGSKEKARAAAQEHVKKHYDEYMNESEELEEGVQDSWAKVQAMDKGSSFGSKEDAAKRHAYLTATYNHHKKFGNDTSKVKADIERLNRSRVQESLQLVELSTGLLKSYGKKAIADMNLHQKKSETAIKKGESLVDVDDKKAEKHYNAAANAKAVVDKRIPGIVGALKRIKSRQDESVLDVVARVSEAKQINEGKGIGIGDLVKFKKLVNGNRYGQITGFVLSKKDGAIHPGGKVSGTVTHFKLKPKADPYSTVNYNPDIQVERENVEKVDQYEEIQNYKRNQAWSASIK